MSFSVGIIGLGMIGEKMLEKFIKHPSFNVAVCGDLNQKVSNQVQAKFPSIHICNNAEQIIENPKIELVYIATPPKTHIEYGQRVIDANKALFMEKPLAIDISKSEKLVKKAEIKGCLTGMNFGYGAGPIVDTLENALTNKEIGSTQSIEIRYEFPSWPLPNQLSAASWITNKHTGGMVREMFSHHVYLIHRLFGLLTVNSVEIYYPDRRGTAEECILATLSTGGIPVRFMGGIGSPQTPRNSNITINGKRGSLRISEGQQLLYAQDGTWKEFKVDNSRTSVEARLDQLDERLSGQDNKLPTLRDGFEVQRVIEELLST
ncbi:MAG: Gfo/Idh/MocA family oxidoreductase [Anaerolineales bacterium]|jgi:predicted dehydrogenase